MSDAVKIDRIETFLANAGLRNYLFLRLTTDTGLTWTSLDGNLPDIPVNVVVPDERSATPVLYAGAEDGLYRSVDSGAHWVRFGNGLPHTPVVDILPDLVRNRLIVATQGRGVFEVLLLRTAP